jgi:hypothetical protein
VTVLEEAESVTVGGWFGKIVGRRSLRRPAKNWKMNPCGSSEVRKPAGKPSLASSSRKMSTKLRPCWFRWPR